jgi:lactoylglutathione lyase
MIRVSQLISRPAAGEGLRLSVSGIAGVTVPVRDLGRAVAFYSRVFGFRIVREGQAEPRRSATLAGPGDALLALHEQGPAHRPVPMHRHWGFVVDNLDRVREAVWDLGVNVAHDNGEPDHIFRWLNGRSLCVSDPDGNEIHLIEECRDSARTDLLRRCPARAAWRRWVKPDCSAAR